MKQKICPICGGNEFLKEDGYLICAFCNNRFAIEKSDLDVKESMISINNDIDDLLEKCRRYPAKARKYANLILDIDPTNKDALKYL